MTKSWRTWMAAIALVAAVTLVVACGGDDDDGGDGGDDPTATTEVTDGGDDATATQEADPTAEDGDGGGDGETGGDAFEGVPVPAGAEEEASGEFSSSQIPFVVPDSDFDADSYGTIEYKSYAFDGSAVAALDFYSDEFSDWDEVFKFSGAGEGGEGAFGVWTRNDGAEAVWIGTASSDGGTALTVIHATTD